MNHLKNFIYGTIISLLVLAVLHCILFGVNSLLGISSCDVFTWSNILNWQDLIIVLIIMALWYLTPLVLPAKWIVFLQDFASTSAGRIISFILWGAMLVLFVASVSYLMFFNLC